LRPASLVFRNDLAVENGIVDLELGRDLGGETGEAAQGVAVT
jgi:hypothetical protein